MFAYKLSTPLPLLEQMFMFDIMLQYKELENIMKQENGDESGTKNDFESKMDDYKSDMESHMNDYKSQFSTSMPNFNSGSMPNLSNISSGFSMPKI